MKKTIKVMAALMLVAAMVFSIASCGGLDMKKAGGDFTITKINDMSVADYAASIGVGEYAASANYSISEKNIIANTITVDGTTNTVTLEAKVRANGVEGYKDGTLALSMVYDDKTDTYSMTLDTGNGTLKYVFSRGTADLAGLYAAANGGAAAEGGEEGGAAEGGEEGGEEGAAEGEGAAE